MALMICVNVACVPSGVWVCVCVSGRASVCLKRAQTCSAKDLPSCRLSDGRAPPEPADKEPGDGAGLIEDRSGVEGGSMGED